MYTVHGNIHRWVDGRKTYMETVGLSSFRLETPPSASPPAGSHQSGACEHHDLCRGIEYSSPKTYHFGTLEVVFTAS